MSIYRRIPAAPLDAYVSWLWYFHDYYPDHERQFVMPEGTFELIINLEDRPRKLFDRGDFNRYRSFRRGWISGTHRGYLVIDALSGSSMIGAHFKPGERRGIWQNRATKISTIDATMKKLQLILFTTCLTTTLNLTAAESPPTLNSHLEPLRPLLGKTWKGLFNSSKPEQRATHR
jgi:hypothetical protein